MKNQRGFTLLELVVAVVVLGVLAAVAIPQYTSFVERSHVAQALSALDAIKTGMIAYHSMTGKFTGIIGDIGVSVGVNESFDYYIYDSNGACVWEFEVDRICNTTDPSTSYVVISAWRGDAAPPEVQWTAITMRIDGNGNMTWVDSPYGSSYNYPYAPKN